MDSGVFGAVRRSLDIFGTPVMNGSTAIGIAAFTILLATSCTSEKHTSKIFQRELPPLPGDMVFAKAQVQSVGKLFKAPPQTIILSWENQQVFDPTNYQTGIEATQNLKDWEEVDRVPYSTKGSLSLTNRPDFEFYRVFNTFWK